MKKNIKFWSLLFLLGSFAIFSGCSDDDEPTGSTDAPYKLHQVQITKLLPSPTPLVTLLVTLGILVMVTVLQTKVQYIRLLK